MLMRFVLCCLLFAISPWLYAVDKKQAEQELKLVKQQIAEQKQVISQQKLDRKSLQQQLRAAEIAIAKTAKSLNQTRKQQQQNMTEIESLQSQQKSLQTQHKQQQQALAKQLESAYMAGKHDYGKLLLNQQDFGKLERIIAYYSYLNDARIGNIEKLKTIAQQLVSVNLSLQNERQRLADLLATQELQQQQIGLQQDNRKEMLVVLNKQISSDQQQLKRLVDDEKTLVKLLAEVRELISEDIQLSGLKSMRGNLPWPTQGRVRHRYGKRKQGQVRWKGIFIEGREGNSVNTIHQGRVLYADWLKGFGLLMVIDHGNGYMSLYGHNQALLKSAGDSVEAGEPVALLGQSGGQSRTGLYFEIRHQGKPVNPSRWLQKS